MDLQDVSPNLKMKFIKLELYKILPPMKIIQIKEPQVKFYY
jgi:hypothetical protein